VLDSKLRANPYFKEDATRFLYPSSKCAKAHLQLMAEVAGLSPAWLNECLVRTADSPRMRLRYCSKCKSPTPPDGFALHFHGGPVDALSPLPGDSTCHRNSSISDSWLCAPNWQLGQGHEGEVVRALVWAGPERAEETVATLSSKIPPSEFEHIIQSSPNLPAWMIESMSGQTQHAT
jgi:hypothetical protein